MRTSFPELPSLNDPSWGIPEAGEPRSDYATRQPPLAFKKELRSDCMGRCRAPAIQLARCQRMQKHTLQENKTLLCLGLHLGWQNSWSRKLVHQQSQLSFSSNKRQDRVSALVRHSKTPGWKAHLKCLSRQTFFVVWPSARKLIMTAAASPSSARLFWQPLRSSTFSYQRSSPDPVQV